MALSRQLFEVFVNRYRAFCWGILLAWLPATANAQSVDSATVGRSAIISISPVELFYKSMVGYEHRWGRRNSVGVLASYHYGSLGFSQGWQATGYYRYYLTRQFPAGLYFQFQLSVLNFMQTANLVDIKTRKPLAFDYRTVSGGGGIGLGYSGPLLRQMAKGRLLYNVLLGFRGNPYPQPSYDANVYRLETNFLGPDFSWYLGFSPGSMVHGLMTLNYLF